MTINNYIYGVYEEFKEYVDNNDGLCLLRDMTFEGGHVPDYSDVHVQQYYLLRFAFAYAFEYKKMYARLLENVGTFNGSVKVCSLGCGAMIDYWALTEILSDKGLGKTVVDYTGIDVIDWNYKFEARERDGVDFIHGNAKDRLSGADALDYDVYIFPKSISEFSNDNFSDMINNIARKNSKDKFYVLISLRTEENNQNSDMERSRQIIDTLCANGYHTTADPKLHWSFIKKSSGIKSLDRTFDYPNEAKELLCNLTNNCGNKDCASNMCESTLKRSPILTANNIYYQVMEFDREVSE